ncbi:MAG TPA: HRDC domain-containing protein, partial [Kofleriaceae bacterium]|nr:HRDC domain-containing protein [Kofleriaceae bacterium]
LGQVLHDKLILDLARQRPRDPAAVRSYKGISVTARQRAGEIVEAIAAARPGVVPTIAVSRPPSPRAQRWSEMLLAIVQLIAAQTGVAARLLATRADAEELARAIDERGLAAADALPAMTGWRRDVIGQPWIGWLTGEIALIGDVHAAHGVRLVPR